MQGGPQKRVRFFTLVAGSEARNFYKYKGVYYEAM